MKASSNRPVPPETTPHVGARFIAPWAADNPPSSPIAAASFAARKPRAAARLADPFVDPATQKIWAEEHALAFTVAGMARDDILAALRDGLTEVIAGKLSREEWLAGARQRLIKAGYWREEGEKGGITPSRLQLIFDTNTANAYHGGRWQRLEERRETHPYLMYLTKRDHRVRPEHRAWEGLILPIDHPFWQTHFPPNGFRCRCAVLGVTQAEYDQLRRDGGQFAGGTVKFDNDVDADNESLDPGFAYNPGIPGSRAAALQRLAEEKAARAEQRAARRAAEAQARAAKKAARDAQRAAQAQAEAKEQATMQPQPAPEPPAPLPAAPETAPAPQPVPVSELANITVTDNTNNKKARARHAPENGNETMRYLEQVASSSAHMGAQLADGFPEHVWEQIANEFSDFAQSVVETGRPQGRWVLVGTLRKNWVEKLQALDISLTTAEIAVSDDDVFHTWRDIKKNKLDWSWYLSLPLHLRRPSLVLLDRSGGAPSLLFVYQTEGNKIAVRYNYNVKSAGRTLNIARSGRRISEDDCKAMLADPSMVLIDENKEP